MTTAMKSDLEVKLMLILLVSLFIIDICLIMYISCIINLRRRQRIWSKNKQTQQKAVIRLFEKDRDSRYIQDVSISHFIDDGKEGLAFAFNVK